MDKDASVNYLIDKLMDYYSVSTNYQLAEKLGMKSSSISSWKNKKSINAIKKKCRELDIYNEIFKYYKVSINGEFTEQAKSDYISFLEHDDSVKDYKKTIYETIDVDAATYILFRESYDAAIKNNDLKAFRIHLMGYEQIGAL